MTSEVETNLSPNLSPRDADHMPPLLRALEILTSLQGQPVSASALKSGLPNADTDFSPSIAVRAAQRAGFAARVVRRQSVTAISPLSLPCVLLLQQGHACVLLSYDDQHAKIVALDAGDAPQKVSLKQVSDLYSGYALFCQPQGRLDARVTNNKFESENWFWGTLKRFKKIYMHVALASLLINLFAIASPLFIMNVYDRVVPNQAMETLWVLALGMMIVFAFEFLLKNLRSYFIDVAGKNADTIIASHLLSHVMGMKLDGKPESTGALANNLRDFESLRDFFTSGTLALIIDLPFVLLFIAVIGLIAGPVAWVPLLAVPTVILVGLALQKPLGRVIEATHKESSQKHAMLIETLNGLETIKAAGAQSRLQGQWEKVVAMTADSATKARSLSTLAMTFTQTAMQFVTILVVIWGVYRIGDGTMTVGALIAATILTGRALAPLGQVAGLVIRYQQSRVSLNALESLMNAPHERPLGRKFQTVPSLKGRIEFRDVSFTYPRQQKPALNKVSFRIDPGERVGILGRVGSGKTTITRLIHGLYEAQEGTVLLDGIDIRQIDPADLRSHIGFVGQDNYLFYGTVRENIAFGLPQASHAQIEAAASLAGVMDFLRNHPQGLDAQVGERGMALSGGQRQAVTLARALVSDPSILLFDQPTSHMDQASELKFKQRVLRASRDRTMIFVTHRQAIMEDMGRLIVMDGGKMIANGARDEILQVLRRKPAA